MRILFITPSYKPAYVYGGPVVVISLLAETLVQLGHDVTVYTTTANGLSELPVTPGSVTTLEGVTVHYFKRITKDHTHVSFTLWRKLHTTAQQFNVIHIHSWWNILVLGAAFICKNKKIKFVLSPHGMFSDYVLNTNNANSKKWMHQLLGKSLLSHTTLHASSQMEWDESQKILPRWPGAIISNIVALPLDSYPRTPNEVFTIGFLSRIDPKKGLDILIEALSQVTFTYRLLIAGDGDASYIKQLKQLAEKLGNQDSIYWAGWKNGMEKFSFLSGLDLFSLTSHSENFAIVIIESLSVGTPVLISRTIGLASYIDQYQLGWVAQLDIATVVNGLEDTYRDVIGRKRIQAISPKLIEQHFDRFALARQYVELYHQNTIGI